MSAGNAFHDASHDRVSRTDDALCHARPRAPLRKNLWQLIVSSVLLGLWILFLGWMAVAG